MDRMYEMLDSADQALDAGEPHRALEIVRRALESFPDVPEVWVAQGDVLWELEDFRAAERAFAEAARRAPNSLEIQVELARAHFLCCDFDAAQAAAERANRDADFAEACDLLARLAERRGAMETADEWCRRARADDPENYPLPYRVSSEEFEKLVQEALDEVPPEFLEVLDGELVILHEPVPSHSVLTSEQPYLSPDLLGLFVGTPRTSRTAGGSDLPDRIYLFQHNLEHMATNRQELVEAVSSTVKHELGHVFGFEDDELHERGY